MITNRQHAHGFTLLEIMIALAVFAILATITSTALYNAFNIQARITTQASHINALQLAITFIKRDTEQMLARAIHGNEMHVFPPFIGQSHHLEFTRSGFVNPDATQPRSALTRVAFLCKKSQLIRRSWAMLDIPERKLYQDHVLLDNLDQCSFAYLAHNRQILSTWQAYAVQQNQRSETLPTAIQLSLKTQRGENMILLFIVPVALYAD